VLQIAAELVSLAPWIFFTGRERTRASSLPSEAAYETK
jgi:hypothetical protein